MNNIIRKIFGLNKVKDPLPIEGIEVARVSKHGFQSEYFELCIPQGRHLPSGHIALPNGAFYTIQLSNTNTLSCNATVEIDGKLIGTWRIPADSTIELERPIHDTGRFTFYKLGTGGGIAAGLTETEKLGLISVTFTPELRVQNHQSNIRRSTLRSNQYSDHEKNETNVKFSRHRSFERGGTGISGSSQQEFSEAEFINLDTKSSITIHARLVAYDSSPRPLRSINQDIPPPLP